MTVGKKIRTTDAKTAFDVVVLGGGAAGLMAAATAARRGKKTLLLEVSNKLGKKILMSGGGRCNFTNLEVASEHFICDNPHFVKSALAQYSNWDFIDLVERHGVAYHEKEQGQLFCDNSSKDILKMLTSECEEAGVEIRLLCEVSNVGIGDDFTVATNFGVFDAKSLLVATGGLSIPTLGGATGLGYRIAQQCGLEVNPTEASLVPFTLSGKWHQLCAGLAGVSLPVIASVPSKGFTQDLLFTHRGLSGPAILQLSNYWYLGEQIEIDLLPGQDLQATLLENKKIKPNTNLASVLVKELPRSLVLALQELWWPEKKVESLQEFSYEELALIANKFHHWQLTPSGTEGYRTAEVTRGGVDVSAISSKTMQVNHQPGLFFIGEVLDVTGYLGGFNFQWAWSSGYVAGQNC